MYEKSQKVQGLTTQPHPQAELWVFGVFHPPGVASTSFPFSSSLQILFLIRCQTKPAPLLKCLPFNRRHSSDLASPSLCVYICATRGQCVCHFCAPFLCNWHDLLNPVLPQRVPVSEGESSGLLGAVRGPAWALAKQNRLIFQFSTFLATGK